MVPNDSGAAPVVYEWRKTQNRPYTPGYTLYDIVDQLDNSYDWSKEYYIMLKLVTMTIKVSENVETRTFAV